MHYLSKLIDENIVALQRAIEIVEAFSPNTPEGRIEVDRSSNSSYKLCYTDEDGNRRRKFISKDDPMLTKIAQKNYYDSVKPLLHKELRALISFKNNFCQSDIVKKYDSLCDERRALIKPIFPTPKFLIDKYSQLPHGAKHDFQGDFVSNRGERVRSKSELYIANCLYDMRDTFFYIYEPEIKLKNSGTVVYPDFLIINLITGEIYLWEHFGMLDNPEYANSFVKKNNMYLRDNLISGKNIIYSFESSTYPLNTLSIKSLLNSIR